MPSPVIWRATALRWRLSVATAAIWLGACVGSISETGSSAADPKSTPRTGDHLPDKGPGTPGARPERGACKGADPGPAVIRKLNRREYTNTIRHLLDPDSSAGTDFAVEEKRMGFDNNAVALNVSPLLVEQYLLSAEQLAAGAVARNLNALLGGCDPAQQGEDACAKRFIETFGRRAYRRPVPAEDVVILTEAYQAGKAADGFRAGIEAALATMLQAPRFLYRVEQPPAPGQIVPLDSWEMASRLSYFLWGSMPDDKLFAAAQEARLSTREQIASEVTRMLADAKARDIVATFNAMWLELDHIDDLEKDVNVYKSFTPAVAKSMRAEVTAFLDEAIWRGAGDIETLFLAPYTFIDKTLAKFYKLPEPAGTGLTKTMLDPLERGGLLTRGGIMAMLANSNQSSPVVRGKFVREQLLCQQMPPPPMDVVIELPKLDPNLTTRERFREHAENSACSGCHRLMDPIGLGFEAFDGVGLIRTSEGGRPLDLTGEIVDFGGMDGRFVGAGELGRKLANSAMVRDCVIRHWFRFAMGRAEIAGSGDDCSIGTVADRFEASGYKLVQLIQGLTETDAFLYKKGAAR